eukprot:2677275-Ditylum_brightwellii.AAC.1
MDELATEAKHNITTALSQRRQHQYPAAKIHLTSNNKTITRKINQAIQETFTGTKLKEDLLKRFTWTQVIYKSIDWDLHGSLLVKLPFYTHRFTVKLIHERLPVQ